MRKLVLLSILSLLGCSDDTNITPDPTSSTGTDATSSTGAGAGGNGAGGGMVGGGFESGSRLKVRTLVGTDGSRQPAGWFDSELNVECSWRTDATGTQRCLPLAHRALYYTDAACTNPVVRFACGAPIYTYAEAPVDECNENPTQIYQLGGQTTVPADIHFRNANGDCNSSITPAGTYYAVGPIVPGASFVQASVEIEQ